MSSAHSTISKMKTEHQEGIGRFYLTPDGKYPSVTTVLSVFGDHTFLDDWRERVGDEEADRVSKESTDIGQFMHECFELYTSGRDLPIPTNKTEKEGLRLFLLSKRKFDNLVSESLHMEVAVWSNKFRIAGKFDLICRLKDGRVVLLDYKTTKRDKKKKDIENYRLQLAFYARMIKETMNIIVEEQIVFMVSREGYTKVFRFQNSDTSAKELASVRKEFYLKYGI